MNILDIIIIIFIIFIIFQYLKSNKQYPIENFDPNNFQPNPDPSDSLDDDSFEFLKDKQFNDSDRYLDIILKKKKKMKELPYFVEEQFQKDYLDVINAFSLLIPNQKQLFNRSNLPILSSDVPSFKEVRTLIATFIKELNNTLKNQVHSSTTLDNWNKNTYDKNETSGWEKSQEELGLPPSIYNPPLGKAPVRLVKMDHAEKYETESEIRYITFLIVHKQGATDQMVVKVTYVMDKRDIDLDRDFFDKKKNSYESPVKLEEIFIIGFLTDRSFGEMSYRDKFYNFEGVTDGRMFNQKQIIEQLNEKKRLNAINC